MNNNPMHITHSSIRWKGMSRQQNDPHFVEFKSPMFSYCAAFIIFFYYRHNHGCITVRQLVNCWAPSAGFDRRRLLHRLSKSRTISLDKPIAGCDFFSYINIMYAISRSINDCIPSRTHIAMGLWHARRALAKGFGL